MGETKLMRKCVVCGCLFPVNKHAITCSIECRKQRNREVNNKAHRVAYAQKKIKNNVKAFKPTTFEEDVAEARRLGMSYGTYKARQQQMKMKGGSL